jgi:two-component system OmpR family sensor kinase
VIGWPSSLRVRLALWHSLLVGLPLAIFAIVCYVAFSRALVGGTDRFIAEALAAFTRELGAERRAGLTAQQAMITTVHEVRFRELHIMILDPAGRVVASAAPPDTTGLPDRSAAIERQLDDQVITRVSAAAREDGPLQLQLDADDGAYRVRAQRLDVDGVGFVLAGRYPLREAEQTMADVRRLFVVAIPLFIVAAAVSGYFLARRNLAPVATMAERAAAITATNLHERLPVGGGDELVRLARVVNDLLDRLEQAFELQRRFMADASHELRTPTAIVRTEADVTLSKPVRHEAEYRESVTIMQDASRRLTRIVDDLFLLARSDAGHLVVHRATIHLEDVVDDTVRSARPLADTRGVRMDLTNVVEAPLQGDADLLGRLLLNLLDNAIKHSAAGGQVAVTMERDGDAVRVTVTDQGEGIPAALQGRVFERFFRADAARTRQETTRTSGAGLGLAISRRIAEAHAGRLELVESRPGHTAFQLTLPVDLPAIQRRETLVRS